MRGDWMQTYTGKAFYPLDPDLEMIDIVDIAHALSMQCRYAGHCTRFYSVAEHSVHVSMLCPDHHALWGLLHDASEAYLADVIKPIKPYLTGYAVIEARIMECICHRFGLSLEMPEVVKQIDRDILGNERDQIMNAPPRPWYATGDPIAGLTLQCWQPQLAKEIFLTHFYALIGEQ